MRAGVFEQAEGGTLLIDELGDLEIGTQAKLLRAVQRGEIQRVGGSKWIKVDVRVLAATRRNLEREIEAGRFRDDLYYRLAVARIDLPPLRHRQGDVTRLAQHFWEALGGPPPVDAAFLDRLEGYGWPGNVRELYNAVAHRLALGDLADESKLQRPSFAPEVAESTTIPKASVLDQVLAEQVPFPTARQRILLDFEQRYTESVLSRHGGNITKAAAASGLARRYFYVLRSRQAR
jgi:DNA-binding NtrC family response regulator